MSKTSKIVMKWVARVAVIIIFLVGWQLTSMYKIINPVFISYPSSILLTFLHLITLKIMWKMIGVTYYEVIVGFILGAVSGSLVGLGFFYVPRVYDAFKPYVIILYSLPLIIFAPIFILLFGIGPDSKIFIAMYGVFFLFLLNIIQALGNVSKTMINAVKIMGANRLTIFRKVTLPYIMPWMTSSIKLGMGIAFVGAIIGEFIESPTNGGIGWYIDFEVETFRAKDMFAGIVLLALVIVITIYVLDVVEKRIVKWSPSAS